MDSTKSSTTVYSDLEQFFQENEHARKNLINNLIQVFPQYSNNIAPFRKYKSTGKLVIWIINHPESIPELSKWMELNDGTSILENISAKAFDHQTSIISINAAMPMRRKKERKFLDAWAKYENDALLEKIKQLKDEIARLKADLERDVG